MKRREFIAGLGGTVVSSLARAAQAKRVGLLMPFLASDVPGQDRVRVFLTAMQELGWVDGRNMSVDLRWATSDENEIRKQANELVALTPDVIIANGSAAVGPLL